ncbi:NAD(P)/FAD-dependent oxidoreductase [Candidatus Tokpelaia sp.]|uniref:NAD(P)/FAD-dependent oxidoreductase n=1 Tax=Candidatus Tokpelaia sp. TaxID=2233777 RepID=UPI001238BFC5|nr:thioredoxin-disulfide reductase [Candidatus Tokpelaia sp.]KAA6405079.1 thioredoxin-disulfide reductase [Candidatus Tokpelaia sp.]
MTHYHSSVLIIGSGPAGWTAAIYAARAMLKPVLITGLSPGGQLTITTDIENYPGFAEPVGGPWLMEQMAEQAAKAGTKIIYDVIVKADLAAQAGGTGLTEGAPQTAAGGASLDRPAGAAAAEEAPSGGAPAAPFRLYGDSGDIYTGDSLIIATGAQARWLGLPSEQKFMGGGVSACATCDGFFFRGRDVAVVGGGNSAVEDALYLAHIAKTVTLIHRRDSLRAEKIMQKRLFACDNVRFVWDTEIEEILGEERADNAAVNAVMTGLRVKNVKTGLTSEIAVDGVFIAIGHAPATALFAGQLRQKPGGYLWTEPGSTASSVAGVFAAGDVADDVFRQAVTAAGSGCMAALEAERFLIKRGL